jgi:hypothetical protein
VFDSAPQHSAQAVLSGLQRLASSYKGSSDSQNASTTAPQADNSCSAADSKRAADDCNSGSGSSSSSSSSFDATVCVLIGIDSHDESLLQHQQQMRMLELFAAAGVPAKVLIFSEADRAGHGPGAVCHLWGLMAWEAVKEGCNLAVLLGELVPSWLALRFKVVWFMVYG